MRYETLDSNTSYYLGEALDTWFSVGYRDIAVPEAAGGSSARVFLLKHTDGTLPWRINPPAFKVMRHDKQAYATPPLFVRSLRYWETSKASTPSHPCFKVVFFQAGTRHDLA